MSERKHVVSGSELLRVWDGGRFSHPLGTEAQRLCGRAQVREAARGTRLPDLAIKHMRRRTEAGEVSRNKEPRREVAELLERSRNGT